MNKREAEWIDKPIGALSLSTLRKLSESCRKMLFLSMEQKGNPVFLMAKYLRQENRKDNEKIDWPLIGVLKRNDYLNSFENPEKKIEYIKTHYCSHKDIESQLHELRKEFNLKSNQLQKHEQNISSADCIENYFHYIKNKDPLKANKRFFNWLEKTSEDSEAYQCLDKTIKYYIEILDIEEAIERVNAYCILIDEEIKKIVNMSKKHDVTNKTHDIEKLSNKDLKRKIRWIGTDKEILVLFELLNHAGYIDQESYRHCQSLMSNFFINKSHDTLNRDSLNALKSKLKKEDTMSKSEPTPIKSVIADKIINDLDNAYTKLDEEWKRDLSTKTE